MLKIQVYCSLLFLSIFIVSMLSSCTRPDINSTYALFSYYALLTHRQNNSLRGIIIILIVTSIVVTLADIWAILLLKSQQVSSGNRIVGYVWIVLQIGLKVALIVMLSMWYRHTSKLEEQQRGKYAAVGNSLVEEN